MRKPSVLISVITRQFIHAPTVQWLLKQRYPVDIVHGAGTIEHQRNWQVERFLERDEDYLFLTDDDVVPVEDTIEILLPLQGPQQITAAPSLGLGADGIHSIPMAYHQDADGLYYPLEERTGTWPAIPGTSGALLPRRLFSEIPRPWFKMPHDDGGKLVMSEDIYFWKKVADVGYTILVNLDLLADHIKTLYLGSLPPYLPNRAYGTRF